MGNPTIAQVILCIGWFILNLIGLIIVLRLKGDEESFFKGFIVGMYMISVFIWPIYLYYIIR